MSVRLRRSRRPTRHSTSNRTRTSDFLGAIQGVGSNSRPGCQRGPSQQAVIGTTPAVSVPAQLSRTPWAAFIPLSSALGFLDTNSNDAKGEQPMTTMNVLNLILAVAVVGGLEAVCRAAYVRADQRRAELIRLDIPEPVELDRAA